MPQTCFALVYDPSDRVLEIRIFRDRSEAESARARSMSQDAEIVRMMVKDRSILEDHGKPIHIAYTIEDDGIRIHGAFPSLLGLNTYLLSHYHESHCRSAIAWLAVDHRSGIEQRPAAANE